jgi:hypothetical protein
MSAKSYPIPKPVWDALENVLLAKSRELIKDIAKTLHQSEKPLLEAFKANKHTFHLLDMTDPTDEKFQCEAVICDKAVAHRCRKPVILGEVFCPEHEFHKAPAMPSRPQVTRLKTADGQIYFVDTLRNVYTAEYERVGTYEDGTLTLFEVVDDIEFA